MLAKKWVGYCKVRFLWGTAVVYQADDIFRAAEVIPD